MTNTASPLKKTIPQALAPRVLKPIAGSRIGLAQHRENHWRVEAPYDFEVSDFLEPGVWAFAEHMRRGDRVAVMQELRWIELVVADAWRGGVQMALVSAVELPERRMDADAALPAGYSIRRSDPADKALGAWVAIRDRDNLVMNPDHQNTTYREAKEWLLSHRSVVEHGPRKQWHE